MCTRVNIHATDLLGCATVCWVSVQASADEVKSLGWYHTGIRALDPTVSQLE